MSEQIVVTRKCVWCKQESKITIDKEKFMRWQKGELIQRVFPEMDKGQREQLISGTHSKCWDEMWNDDGT